MVALLVILGVRKPYAVLAFGLCALVAAGILLEWTRGTRARHRRGENYALGLARLIAANRPRYGGYIVHLAVVFLALGVVGSSFYDTQIDVILTSGRWAEIGEYQIEYLNTKVIEKSDRTEFVSTVNVYKDGKFLRTLSPRRAFYPEAGMTSTRAAIHSTPVEDLYIISGVALDDGSIGFRVFVNPLVWWLWVAGPIFILGTLVALWPSRQPAMVYVAAPAPPPMRNAPVPSAPQQIGADRS